MRRSAQVSAPLLASVALAILSGCRRPEMQRCVDENNKVVDDSLCQNLPNAQGNSNGTHGGIFFFPYRYYYYGGFGGRGLGSTVSGGSLTPMAGHSYSTGTSRGGFGRSFSGGHGSGGGGE